MCWKRGKSTLRGGGERRGGKGGVIDRFINWVSEAPQALQVCSCVVTVEQTATVPAYSHMQRARATAACSFITLHPASMLLPSQPQSWCMRTEDVALRTYPKWWIVPVT